MSCLGILASCDDDDCTYSELYYDSDSQRLICDRCKKEKTVWTCWVNNEKLISIHEPVGIVNGMNVITLPDSRKVMISSGANFIAIEGDEGEDIIMKIKSPSFSNVVEY